jgi:hypothetical protein
MYKHFFCKLLFVALLASGAAACDDEVPATPTTPTTPVTETFSGTLSSSGAATHNFRATGAGTVTATLRTIGSDNTLVVGFSMGTWNGTACSIVLANDTATGNAVHNGTMTAAGDLCVRVYDVGNIAAGTAAPYSIEVVHP